MLQFRRFSKQWYWDANRNSGCVDDIMIGNYYQDDGCDWEFSIKEFQFRGSDSSIKLAIFSDAVLALSNPIIIKAMTALEGCKTLNEAENILIDNHIHEIIKTQTSHDTKISELTEQKFRITINSEADIMKEEIRGLIKKNDFIKKVSVETI